MSEDTNLMHVTPFKGETCFDCKDPSRIWECIEFFVPGGKNLSLCLCERCANIRDQYLSETKKILPLEVICDGCKTDSHNEHHCEYKDVTVDGIKTYKSCSCEECFCGEPPDIQKFLGPHF